MPRDIQEQLEPLTDAQPFGQEDFGSLDAASEKLRGMGVDLDAVSDKIQRVVDEMSRAGKSFEEAGAGAAGMASAVDSLSGAFGAGESASNDFSKGVDNAAKAMSGAGGMRIPSGTPRRHSARGREYSSGGVVRHGSSERPSRLVRKTIVGQPFASGGSVHYTKANSDTARRGGRFVGRRHGDREIAFVNAGEAIITEKAVKSGARQAGMSVSSYVGALNKGNLKKIKQGRSFAEGGISDDMMSWARTSSGGSHRAGSSGQNDDNLGFKRDSEKWKNARLDIARNYGVDIARRGMANNDLGRALSSINGVIGKDGTHKNNDELKRVLNELAKEIRAAQKTPEKSSILSGAMRRNFGDKFDINAALEQLQRGNEVSSGDFSGGLDDFINAMEKAQEEVDNMNKILKGYEDKVQNIEDVMDEWGKMSERAFENMVDSMGVLGKWINDVNNKYMKLIGTVAVGVKTIAKSADFFKEQSSINIGFDKAAASAKAFGNAGVESLQRMGKALDLDRKQMTEMAGAMADVGRSGMADGRMIESMAANMKAAFGEVDMTALKEAASILKDLPQQQAGALFGPSSFGDEANMLTNLANSGNLDKVIELQMKGAFGEQEGMANVDEKDRAVVEAQQKANKDLDDIRKVLYDMSPKLVATGSQRAKGFLQMVGVVTGVATALKPLMGAYRILQQGVVKVQEQGPGSSETANRVLAGDHVEGEEFARGRSGGGSSSGGGTNPPGTPPSGGGKSGKSKASTAGGGVASRVLGSSPTPPSSGGVASSVLGGAGNNAESRLNKIFAKIGGPLEEALGPFEGTVKQYLGDGLMSKASKIAGNFASQMLKMGPALGGLIGLALVKKFASWREGKAKKIEARRAIEMNPAKNMSLYGNEMGRALTNDVLGKKAKGIRESNKSMVAFATTAVTLGAAIGSVIPGAGTLAGALGGALVGAISAAGAAVIGFVKGTLKAKNEMKARDALSYGNVQKRGWYNPARWFGGQYSMDKNKGGEDLKKYLDSRMDSTMRIRAGMSGNFVKDENGKAVTKTTKTVERSMMNPARWFGSKTYEAKNKDEFGRDITQFQEKIADGSVKWVTIEEYQKKQMQQLVTLNKHLKNIEAITKGVYSSYTRETAKSRAANLEAMSAIGGSNAGFKSNVSAGMRGSAAAWRADFGALQRKKSDIVSKSDMTGAQRAVALNKVMQAELTVHQNYITEMSKFIGKIGQMPDMMIRDIKEGVRKAMMDFQATSFVGGGAGAAAQAQAGMADALASLNDARDYASSTLPKLVDNLDGMKKSFESYAASTRARLKELNGGEYTEADSARDSNAIDEYQRELQEMGVHDNSGLQESLAKIDEVFRSVGGKNEKDVNGQDVANVVNAIEDALGQVRELERNTTGADKEQYGELISMMEKTSKNVQDQAKNGKVVSVLAEGSKRFTDAMRTISNAASTQQMQEAADKIKKKTGVDVNEAQVRQSLDTAANGASNNAVNTEKMLADELKSHIEKYQKISQQLVDNMNAVFNNGSVTFAKKMASILESRREQLQASSANGVEAGRTIFSAQLDEVGAKREAANNGVKLAEQMVANLDKNLSGEGYEKLNEQQKEVLQAEKKAVQARQRSILNPEDKQAKAEAARLASEADMKRAALVETKDANGESLANNPLFKSIETSLGATSAAVEKAADGITDAMNAQIEIYKKIPQLFETALNHYQNRLARTIAEGLSKRADFTEKYGNYNEAIGQSGKALKASERSYKMDLAAIEETLKESMTSAAKAYDDEIKAAGGDQKKIREAEIKYSTAIEESKKQYEESRMAATDKHYEKISQHFDRMLGRTQRIGEALDIQKDVANTIGAPFEMVLGIEQKIVQNAREQAKIEEEKLAEMEKNHETGKAYEEQKLKVAQAQAKVLKASFGAQRDSLDKMLGKMMGTFQEINGIFGPDSVKMMAKKYGQGYGMNESGMASQAGEGAHNSFEARRTANADVANGFNPARGNGDYNMGSWSSPDSARNAVNMAGQVMRGFSNGGAVIGKKTSHVPYNVVRRLTGTASTSPRDTEMAVLSAGESVVSKRKMDENAMDLGLSSNGLANALVRGEAADYILENSRAIESGLREYAGGGIVGVPGRTRTKTMGVNDAPAPSEEEIKQARSMFGMKTQGVQRAGAGGDKKASEKTAESTKETAKSVKEIGGLLTSGKVKVSFSRGAFEKELFGGNQPAASSVERKSEALPGGGRRVMEKRTESNRASGVIEDEMGRKARELMESLEDNGPARRPAVGGEKGGRGRKGVNPADIVINSPFNGNGQLTFEGLMKQKPGGGTGRKPGRPLAFDRGGLTFDKQLKQETRLDAALKDVPEVTMQDALAIMAKKNAGAGVAGSGRESMAMNALRNSMGARMTGKRAVEFENETGRTGFFLGKNAGPGPLVNAGAVPGRKPEATAKRANSPVKLAMKAPAAGGIGGMKLDLNAMAAAPAPNPDSFVDLTQYAKKNKGKASDDLKTMTAADKAKLKADENVKTQAGSGKAKKNASAGSLSGKSMKEIESGLADAIKKFKGSKTVDEEKRNRSEVMKYKNAIAAQKIKDFIKVKNVGGGGEAGKHETMIESAINKQMKEIQEQTETQKSILGVLVGKGAKKDEKEKAAVSGKAAADKVSSGIKESSMKTAGKLAAIYTSLRYVAKKSNIPVSDLKMIFMSGLKGLNGPKDLSKVSHPLLKKGAFKLGGGVRKIGEGISKAAKGMRGKASGALEKIVTKFKDMKEVFKWGMMGAKGTPGKTSLLDRGLLFAGKTAKRIGGRIGKAKSMAKSAVKKMIGKKGTKVVSMARRHGVKAVAGKIGSKISGKIGKTFVGRMAKKAAKPVISLAKKAAKPVISLAKKAAGSKGVKAVSAVARKVFSKAGMKTGLRVGGKALAGAASKAAKFLPVLGEVLMAAEGIYGFGKTIGKVTTKKGLKEEASKLGEEAGLGNYKKAMSNFSDGEWLKGIKEMFAGVAKTLLTLIDPVAWGKAIALMCGLFKVTMDDLTNGILKPFKGVWEAWKEYAKACFDFWKAAWDGVVSTGKKAFVLVKDYFVGIWNDVSKSFKLAFGSIPETIKNVVAKFKAGDIKGVISESLKGVVNLVKGLAKGAVNMFVSSVKNAMKFYLIIPRLVLNLVGKVVKGFMRLPAQLIKFIATGIKFVLNGFLGAIKAFKSMGFSGVIDYIKDIFDDVFGGGGEGFWSELWGFTKECVKEAWSEIASIGLEMWESVKSIASDSWECLTDAFAELGTAFMEIVPLAGEVLWEALSGLGDMFMTVIGDQIDGAFDFVKDSWQYIKESVDAMIDLIVENFKLAWDTIVKVFTGDFSGAIDNISEMFGNGVDFMVDGFKRLVNFIWKVFNDVLDMIPGMKQLKRAVGSLFGEDEGKGAGNEKGRENKKKERENREREERERKEREKSEKRERKERERNGAGRDEGTVAESARQAARESAVYGAEQARAAAREESAASSAKKVMTQDDVYKEAGNIIDENKKKKGISKKEKNEYEIAEMYKLVELDRNGGLGADDLDRKWKLENKYQKKVEQGMAYKNSGNGGDYVGELAKIRAGAGADEERIAYEREQIEEQIAKQANEKGISYDEEMMNWKKQGQESYQLMANSAGRLRGIYSGVVARNNATVVEPDNSVGNMGVASGENGGRAVVGMAYGEGASGGGQAQSAATGGGSVATVESVTQNVNGGNITVEFKVSIDKKGIEAVVERISPRIVQLGMNSPNNMQVT